MAVVGVVLFVPVAFCSGTEPNCACTVITCGWTTSPDFERFSVGFLLIIGGILVYKWSSSIKLLRFMMKLGYKGNKATTAG